MSKPKRSSPVLDDKMAEAILGGGDDYDTYLASVYFKNLLDNTDVASPVAYRICSAIEGNIGQEEIEGFPNKKLKDKGKTYLIKDRPKRNSVDVTDWDILKKYHGDIIAAFGSQSENTYYKNLRTIGEQLYLSPVEIDVLRFLHVATQNYPLSSFMNDFIGSDQARVAPAIARMIGHPKELQKISTMLDPSGSLTMYGLVDLPASDDYDDDGGKLPTINESIQSLLHIPDMKETNVVDLLIGKPLNSDLDIDDFSYLEKDIKEIAKIVRKAIKEKAPGINIMLYGPAGSGKTALAGTIAKSLGLHLYAIGEEQDGDGESAPSAASTAKHRLGKLFQAHAFLKDSDKAILLFDEVEDLLMKGEDSGKKADSFSKIIINRLLEKNPIVTIWACNDSDKFHESMRQRFSYSVQVDYPPVQMRKKIWDRQLGLNGVNLDNKEVLGLAREYKAPPRMIANAVRMAAEDGKVDAEEIRQIMHASSRITYGNSQEIKTQGGIPARYDLGFMNYDERHQNELSALIESGTDTVPYAILLQGPRGSGLRTFGRFMAEKAMMNQQEYDVAALIAPNPFESPYARIESAFERAKDSRELLVFSNLDRLADDPENENGWKGDLTTFFMKHMVGHDLPIIAHSFNRKAEFPGQVTDAFSLQMKVNPLNPSQCQKAHRTYFGREPEETVSYPANLVIADFSAVSKIVKRSTNGHTEPNRLLELLKRQATYRESDQRKIGF